MSKRLGMILTGVSVIATCIAAMAEPLPKSGSISVHSGYLVVGEALTVADKHIQGHGTDRGVTFNDKGSGPLHLGPTDCVYTFDAVGDSSTNKGYCTFGDADGDRIFTDFRGTGTPDGYFQGMHEIISGTGKYTGIQGNVPWKCKYAGTNGEFQCTQRFDYKLP
jgi:hypothetical protein